MQRKVSRRYVPLATHSKWERLEEYRISPRRVLRPGYLATIHGIRGGVFRFIDAQRNTETGAVVLNFVGGKSGRVLDRSFTPDKVKRITKVIQ